MKTKSKKASVAKYKRTVEWDEDDQIWVVKFPELPGCSTHGATAEEAMKNGDEALALYLESLKARGIQPPAPISMIKASGNFMIRTTPELHKKLMIRAEEKETSMNKLFEEILKASV